MVSTVDDNVATVEAPSAVPRVACPPELADAAGRPLAELVLAQLLADNRCEEAARAAETNAETTPAALKRHKKKVAAVAGRRARLGLMTAARRAKETVKSLSRLLAATHRLRALRTLAGQGRRLTARARQRRPRRAALRRQLCRAGRGRKRHRGGSDGDPDGGVTDAVATGISTDVRDGARVSP